MMPIISYRMSEFRQGNQVDRVKPVGKSSAVGQQGIPADVRSAPQDSQSKPLPRTPFKAYEDVQERLLSVPDEHPLDLVRGVWNPYSYYRSLPEALRVGVVYDENPERFLNNMEWAFFMARHYQAGLVVCCVLPQDQFDELRPKLEQQVRDFCQPYGDAVFFLKDPPQVKMYADTDWKNGVMRFIHEQRVGLLVMHYERHNVYRAFFDGMDVERMALMSDAPVLMVPDGSPAPSIKQVLVPVENTEFSHAAVAQGVALGRDFNAKLHLLHVESKSGTDTTEEMLGKINWQKVDHDYLDASGPVEDVIERASDETDASLIIMTTHSHEKQDYDPFHHVTTRMLQRLKRPMLILHPRGKS
jgi:nucleotide-binding universal stress UspA family protein